MDEIVFYRESENGNTPLNVYKEFSSLIAYPEYLREMEIEGRWIYEVYFDHQTITSWTLRKSVEDSQLKEREIEKALGKLKPTLRYFFKGNCSVVFRITAILKD